MEHAARVFDKQNADLGGTAAIVRLRWTELKVILIGEPMQCGPTNAPKMAG